MWGGEDGSYDSSLGVVSTASYGRVYISIKSTTGNVLTSAEKNQLVTDLAPYTVASITPIIVDPETIYLILNTTFKFDSSATTSTAADLVSSVNTTITNYNTNNLKQFDGMFRHSKLTGLIDSTDTSILSNVTNITLAKYITPTTTESTSYTVNFNNALYNPHSDHNKAGGGIIASTGFYISGDTTNEMFFDDDGSGVLRLYYLVSGARVYQDATAGTINYSTGEIKIDGIHITTISSVDGVSSTKIRITTIPDSKDIIPVRNQLLEIDFTNTTITGEVDTIATGNTGAGASYTTTSAYSSTSSY